MKKVESHVILCEVTNYIVRSYTDVIVVTNSVTRRTSKAKFAL